MTSSTVRPAAAWASASHRLAANAPHLVASGFALPQGYPGWGDQAPLPVRVPPGWHPGATGPKRCAGRSRWNTATRFSMRARHAPCA